MTEENNVEEHLKIFEEQWAAARELSENLTWAIFPIGNKEIEFQAAKYLMNIFPHLEGFIYFKEDQDPEIVVQALEDVLEQYRGRNKDRLATAVAENNYQLNFGA